ncbi:MAG: hypothetical protein ISR55_12965 [Bacteroidetes bacterium]|nr:hypothetical protein [Bacteroidota bacterium]
MFRNCILLLLIGIAGFQQSQAQNPEKDLYLETMAVLSSNNMYMSYVYLGTIADSYIYDAIKKEMCINLLNEYLQLMEISKNQFTKLYESGFLDQEGNDAVLMQVDICQILKEEAGDYLEFVKTGENQHLESFEQNRILAWKKIEDLLGLEQSAE